jgi:hypothetical protein
MGLLEAFRSLVRDAATDIARLAPIHHAVQRAAREASEELNGLKARLDDVGMRSAFLFGSEVDSPALHDPEEKARLDGLESELRRGQIRREYLERQTRILAEVARALMPLTKTSVPRPR